MPVQIHLNGQRYYADDGTDPAELQQYAQMHQQEQAQLNPMNQGMQGMQNVFSGINRQIQMHNELPTPTAVPGNTWGMSAQAFNNAAGIIQQDNQMSATAKMQQRVQMEQQMEQEKERSQQLKVQDMQFKNQQKMEKFRLDQEEARLKREAEQGTMTNVSGVGPVQMKNIGGVATATAIPITGANQQKSWKQAAGTSQSGKIIWYDENNPAERMELEIGQLPPDPPAPKYGWVTGQDGNKVYGQLETGTVSYAPPSAASGGMTPYQQQQLAMQRNRSVLKLADDEGIPIEEAAAKWDSMNPPLTVQQNAPLAQGGGQAAPAQSVNPGDTFTGTDGNLYKYLGGNNYEPVGQAQAPLASTPAQPSSAPSNAPLAGTAPPQVNTGYDLMNPVFSAQNGNPYQGPVPYPAPSAVPGTLSRGNYTPAPAAPPRTLEQVIADAQALKAKQFEQRNANLPPVNGGQSLADLARGSGYVAPPDALPRELSAADKWILDTGATITREADAAMRSALTFVARLSPNGKNNSVYADVAKGLLENKVPIEVIRKQFKQYPGVINAVAVEYQNRPGILSGTLLPESGIL